MPTAFIANQYLRNFQDFNRIRKKSENQKNLQTQKAGEKKCQKMLMTPKRNLRLSKRVQRKNFQEAQEGDEKPAEILTQINYNYKIPIIR